MSEFNFAYWNERFKNLSTSVEKVEKKINYLTNLMILTIIGITGWALVQLYAQMTIKAQAAEPTHIEQNK